jgi:PAS domain S-box-containing protein
MNLHPGPEKGRAAEVRLAELAPIQRALHENEDWYQDLVEHSHDLLCIHDLEGRLLAVNPAPARVLGYSIEELLQIPMRELTAPEFRSEFQSYLREIERAGEARGLLTVLTRSGARRIWEFHNTLRTEGVAKPIVRGTAHDVTEQTRAEKLLRETSEALLSRVRENELTIRELKLFRTLVDRSNDAIEVVDPQTLRFLDVNEKACSELGYSREEMLSLGVLDIDPTVTKSSVTKDIDPTVTKSSVTKDIEQLKETGSVVKENLHRRKDGHTFPVEVSMTWVELDRSYVVVIVRDLTERKRTEKLLQKASEELLSKVKENEGTIRELKLFRALMDQSNDAIRVVDPETRRFVDANEKACSELGYTREEMLTLGVFDIDPTVDDAFIAKAREELRRSGSLVIESVHRRKDGVIFPVEVSMKRVELDRDYVIAISRDITERKLAESRLRASQEHYRAVHDRAPVGICWIETVTGRFLGVNPKYCEIVGRTERELLGLTFQNITHPDDVAGNLERLRELVEGQVRHYVMEKRYLRPDGSVRWAEVEIVAMWPEGADPVWHMAIVQDITERKKAEEALRQSEQRFRIALQGSPITVFNQDRDLRYTWVYNTQEGWSEEDYLGKTDEEIFGPEVAARMIAMKRPVLETGRPTRQEFSLTARGKTYYCDITVEPLRDSVGSVIGVNCACVDVTQMREITEELRVAKEKLSEEKLYLEQAIDSELGFGEIIGRSGAIKEVMEKVRQVASSEATVLLLGETGTGKELVARALHRLSNRQANSFIKLNCAAIPSGLLESELFGHEKGAFTGAVAKKIGRLELADQGTLFLDEIGEIPLDLQPKLLRVLQDQEFERLGSTRTLRVNFRLVAATNRNLVQMAKQGEFRSDLYYRLNVFPIHLPALRDRREDIRLLIDHFVRKYALRMNKVITSIPSKTMEALVRWDWPGNVRELENLVERSVILTPGSVLQAPLGELHGVVEEVHGVTLGDKERERILRALQECHGQIGGANGAAARLGLKRTTLQSKINKLGIKRGTYE